MFGIGFSEICIIALFVLVFFGPQKLPELMRQFGKFFVHVRRVSNEVKANFDTVVREAEASLDEEEKKATRRKAAPAAQGSDANMETPPPLSPGAGRTTNERSSEL